MLVDVREAGSRTVRVTWDEVYDRLRSAPAGRLFGVPGAGAVVAGLTGRAVDRLEDADCIVYALPRTSALERPAEWAAKPVWTLFDGEAEVYERSHLVFPWEGRDDSVQGRMERIGRELLVTLGYDPESERLRDTPRRWARWWREFHAFDAGRLDTSFQVSTSHQVVTVSGIRVWSICEHHLLPFVADIAILYVPEGRLLGLSKFARIARRAAHRLQLQERLAEEIADAVTELAGSADVAILVRGRHLCMEVRGIRTPAQTESLVTRGAFRHDPSLRADIRHLAGMAPSRSTAWLEVAQAPPLEAEPIPGSIREP
jgi:GTP cyclohydrolase I